MDHLRLQCLVLHREQDLHTLIQISRHPVGTSHIDLLMSVIMEIEDTAVLQKITDDRADMDILADTRDSGL